MSTSALRTRTRTTTTTTTRAATAGKRRDDCCARNAHIASDATTPAPAASATDASAVALSSTLLPCTRLYTMLTRPHTAANDTTRTTTATTATAAAMCSSSSSSLAWPRCGKTSALQRRDMAARSAWRTASTPPQPALPPPPPHASSSSPWSLLRPCTSDGGERERGNDTAAAPPPPSSSTHTRRLPHSSAAVASRLLLLRKTTTTTATTATATATAPSATAARTSDEATHDATALSGGVVMAGACAVDLARRRRSRALYLRRLLRRVDDCDVRMRRVVCATTTTTTTTSAAAAAAVVVAEQDDADDDGNNNNNNDRDTTTATTAALRRLPSSSSLSLRQHLLPHTRSTVGDAQARREGSVASAHTYARGGSVVGVHDAPYDDHDEKAMTTAAAATTTAVTPTLHRPAQQWTRRLTRRWVARMDGQCGTHDVRAALRHGDGGCNNDNDDNDSTCCAHDAACATRPSLSTTLLRCVRRGHFPLERPALRPAEWLQRTTTDRATCGHRSDDDDDNDANDDDDDDDRSVDASPFLSRLRDEPISCYKVLHRITQPPAPLRRACHRRRAHDDENNKDSDSDSDDSDSDNNSRSTACVAVARHNLDVRQHRFDHTHALLYAQLSDTVAWRRVCRRVVCHVMCKQRDDTAHDDNNNNGSDDSDVTSLLFRLFALCPRQAGSLLYETATAAAATATASSAPAQATDRDDPDHDATHKGSHTNDNDVDDDDAFVRSLVSRGVSVWVAKACALALRHERARVCAALARFRLPFAAAALSVEAMERLRADMIAYVQHKPLRPRGMRAMVTRREMMDYVVHHCQLGSALAGLYKPRPSDVVNCMRSPAEAALVSYVLETVCTR